MTKKILYLLTLVLLITSIVNGQSRTNDITKPGEESSLIFGRIFAENQGKEEIKVAIRDYFSEFEIRVSVRDGVFMAYLPKGFYRVASIKHDRESSGFGLFKTKKLKNCIFMVPENNKIYYIGDIKTDLADYKKVKVKEAKGLPINKYVFNYFIKYSIINNIDGAKKQFYGKRDDKKSEIEKSLVNQGIDFNTLNLIKDSEEKNRRKAIKNAIDKAQEEKSSIFLILRLDVATGGDRIASINSESIHAGDGVAFNMGFIIKPFKNRNLESQITIGYSDEQTPELYDYYSWERKTIELMQFYRFKYTRIGVGGAFHFDPVLKGHGSANGEKTTFDDSFGIVAETDFLVGFRDFAEIFVGIRGTYIRYKNDIDDYNGNSIALSVGFYF